MKPSKETVALVLDGLFGIILWVLSWYAPSALVDILKGLWGVFQPILLALLVKWLKLEVKAFIRSLR